MAKVKKVKKAPKTPEEVAERWLPVKLTDAEIIEKARLMSQRSKERNDLEAEKSGVMKGYAERIKKLVGEIHGLSESVRTGEEPRAVKCTRYFMLQTDRVVTCRNDTGEEIEDREMTGAERQKYKQGSLFDEDDATADSPSVGDIPYIGDGGDDE